MSTFQFNNDLVNDLAHERVVVFIGTGVSASSITRAGRHILNWEAFLSHANDSVTSTNDKRLIARLIKEKDFLLACEILKEALDTDTWNRLIYDEFSQIGDASPLHKAIARLNQRIILTTNFDKLLEDTWSQHNTDQTHFPQVISGLTSDVFRIHKDDRRVIIKLHGTIDDPNGMVFAKADYINKAFSSWVYNQFIESLLLTHTFLFVGFSMADPAISALVENYAHKYPNARPHYIFQGGKVESRLTEVSRKLRKLFIIPYDKKNNHAQLVDLIIALADAGQQRRKEYLAKAMANSK